MERRSEARQPSRIAVTIRLLGGWEEDYSFPATIVDLAGKGARILCHRALTPGCPIQIAAEDRILLAEVVHCQPWEEEDGSDPIPCFAAGLKVEQVVNGVTSLRNLMRALWPDCPVYTRPSRTTPL